MVGNLRRGTNMTNRKWIGMLALGAVFCLLSSAPSLAAIVNPGDDIVFSGAPNRDGGLSGGGGAFLITDTTSKSSWYTFCLERDEYISFGTIYKVGSVGPAAVEGGTGGPNPDPISEQTAYLYYRYATGGLGFTGPGSAVQQAALQYAFWFLEDELATGTKRTDLSSLTQFYLGIADGATPNQYYGVLVVNPVYGTTAKQSQLVYVPEPGAFLLLGSGLIGLIGYRRMRRVE
jgi:hypothetical protein